MWYAPENAEELLQIWFPASQIRSWVRDAAQYHGVPYELAAVILQQENGPNATDAQQVGQFAERSLTTLAAILDEVFFDLVPDRVAGSSSGIANMSRRTLRSGAEYVETTYCKSVLPEDVRVRILGWNQDTRIQGDDLKADLYYMTAHLRQLIDRFKGRCFSGALTLDDIKNIAAAYNGSGPAAVKYGNDAVQRIEKAISGAEPLYFYE